MLSIMLPFMLIFGGFVFGAQTTFAKEKTVNDTSLHQIDYIKVDRVKTLQNFFKKYNSPLELNAETFIKVADQYNIDYKILPAIACVESTCAKFYIKENYNPFGWGSGKIQFSSFDEAIEKIAKGLDEIYLSKGRDTIETIAPVYNPPSPTTWTKSAYYFISQMEEVSVEE